MIPKEIYCRRCGEFISMGPEGSRGEHRHLEDCVDHLVKRVAELEKPKFYFVVAERDGAIDIVALSLTKEAAKVFADSSEWPEGCEAILLAPNGRQWHLVDDWEEIH